MGELLERHPQAPARNVASVLHQLGPLVAQDQASSQTLDLDHQQVFVLTTRMASQSCSYSWRLHSRTVRK